jgi:hypothetical protein
MQSITLDELEARLAALEAAERDAAALAEPPGSVEPAEQDLRPGEASGAPAPWWRAAGLLFLAAGLLAGLPQSGRAQGSTLEERVAELERKTARVRVVNNGADIVLEGMNLQIVNGLGDTQLANGVGNLVIGYNETGNPGGDFRVGSHYLVMGQRNNHNQFGGIVGGFQNSNYGPFSAIITGFNNTANVPYAFIGTGSEHLVSQPFGAILGGKRNQIVNGSYSAIVGGEGHATFGEHSTVTGGFQNGTNGCYPSVSGGDSNHAGADYSSVSGGSFNVIEGVSASISGGTTNRAPGIQSSVSGGWNRGASDTFDWAAGTLLEDQ